MRHETFSYQQCVVEQGKKNDFISKNPGFEFSGDDIKRIRKELKILIENLTHIYKRWKSRSRRTGQTVQIIGN